MQLIWTVLIGFVVGLLAKWLHPGKENMGFILTVLLGIGGSFLATYVGQLLHWYQPGQGAGFIGAVVGAIVLLVLYGLIVKKK